MIITSTTVNAIEVAQVWLCTKVDTKNANDIMAIENVKKTMKLIKNGMFQKMSNWHARPDTTSTSDVIEENTTATMNQLTQ